MSHDDFEDDDFDLEDGAVEGSHKCEHDERGRVTTDEAKRLSVAERLGDEIEWNHEPKKVAVRCGVCRGEGVVGVPRGRRESASDATRPCDECDGAGWFGIDPLEPVDLVPGGDRDCDVKTIVLAVRYAAGVPLWNPGDVSRRGSSEKVFSDKPRVRANCRMSAPIVCSDY